MKEGRGGWAAGMPVGFKASLRRSPTPAGQQGAGWKMSFHACVLTEGALQGPRFSPCLLLRGDSPGLETGESPKDRVEAVWLRHSPQGGLGGGGRKLGPWLRDRGRTARPDGDPLSSDRAGQPSPAPPTPRLPLFKQALGLLLHGNRRLLLFQSDVAALFSTVCFSLKSCHQPGF